MKMEEQYGNDALHGPSGIPSMRIAVTEKCDLKCRYCPTHGDSYRIRGGRLLDKDELVRAACIAHDAGFRAFSITGGEPLLAPDTTFNIAKTLRKCGELEYLRLNTNGLSLREYASQTAENFDMVKISIDRLNTGTADSPGIHGSQSALEGLDSIKELGVLCRVNMVIGKSNLDAVPPMIVYCEEKAIGLKLLDMTRYRHTKSDDPDLWKKEFLSLSGTIKELIRLYGPPITRYSVGGYGNPMLVFKPERTLHNSSSGLIVIPSFI
ncbi:MAG: radical SAM protein, partial [Nanoarchaeota archaeon]